MEKGGWDLEVVHRVLFVHSHSKNQNRTRKKSPRRKDRVEEVEVEAYYMQNNATFTTDTLKLEMC
jgi:hypothetical protein